MSLRVALLEDDKDLASLYCAWLQAVGYLTTCTESGLDLQKELINESYDLVILDWLVPDMEGIALLDWIRNEKKMTVPVIFVSQLSKEHEIVAALKSGADDYMCKPVTHAEFLARVEAATRRFNSSIVGDMVLNMDPYIIDLKNRQFHLDGKVIDLTQKEFQLAAFLFTHTDKSLSRGHILESVWGTDPDLNTRTVDTHISRIRKKLEISEKNGWVLASIYQYGYRLEHAHALTDA